MVALAASAMQPLLPYSEEVGLKIMGFYKSVACGSASRFHPRNTGERRFIRNKVSGENAGVGVMTDRSGCFVALQGTHTKPQRWLDAAFVPVPFRNQTCGGCEVDMGFLLNYEGVSNQIFDALHELACKEKPLFLIGHSLGAAGIHYMLYDALEAGYTVEYAYALESPRPGNKQFAAMLQQKVQGVSAWRTTHHHDIVVQVPPPIILGYSHALHEIFYDQSSGTHYRECHGLEDITCSALYELQPWLWTAKDHCWYAGHNPCECGSLSGADNANTSQSSILVTV